VAELHAAATACVELSLKVAVAVNCWVVPSAMLGATGVTASETSVAPGTPRMGSRPWSPPPHPASKVAARKPMEQDSVLVYLCRTFMVFPFVLKSWNN
jgi:hypothetical protein